jgi:hypothetical protein
MRVRTILRTKHPAVVISQTFHSSSGIMIVDRRVGMLLVVDAVEK